MHRDRYDYVLTTASAEARDAYVTAVDLTLGANHGAEDEFRRAIACDEGLAVAHAGLARTMQVLGNIPEAKASAARAQQLASPLPHRERSHVAALATMIESGSVAGLTAAKEHLAIYPRDAMVLAPCTGVFGLIGFSGRAGREAELLELLDPLADAYGDDWWFTASHAFAQVEYGQVDRAKTTIERSMSQHPRNANGAHYRAHIHYESGEREAGLDYLTHWAKDYPKEALLHCHISWHIALWRLELGRIEEAWNHYRAHLRPGASTGPPINTLSDSASFLLRAEMAGQPRDPALWRELSQYAAQWFPSPGIAFADVHGALAHAFAGNAEALGTVIERAKGPARDVVAPIAQAFGALSRSDWAEALAQLQAISDSHERIGGSRAQRDLIEYSLVVCLLRLGRLEEARIRLQTRRPQCGIGGWPIQGL